MEHGIVPRPRYNPATSPYRVVLASGFILGRPAPLPHLERHAGKPEHRNGNYVEGSKKGWETRRARAR